jgi:alpha-L-rhamnosidase
MRQGQPFYSGGTWEQMTPDAVPSSGSTSLARSWSSGATNAVSQYVLGVRPVEPGYKTWLIEPQTGDLSWAEGTVPTPYGPIEVEWRKTAQGMRLEINVPNGTSGTVGVPANGPSSSLTDNGQPAQEAKKSAPASPSL